MATFTDRVALNAVNDSPLSATNPVPAQVVNPAPQGAVLGVGQVSLVNDSDTGSTIIRLLNQLIGEVRELRRVYCEATQRPFLEVQNQSGLNLHT